MMCMKENRMNKTRFRSGLLLAVAGLIILQSSVADDAGTAGFSSERLERIDAAIKAEIDKGKIPGAVALVVRNGSVAYFKSFGLADIESRVPMHNDAIFRIASMTKAVTTVAAMTLYERGYFRLSDPISKFIPEFADMTIIAEADDDGNVSSTVAATKQIRIIDLMTHTAGLGYPFIPSSVQKSYIDGGIIDGPTTMNVKLADQMKLLAGQPLMFEPGSKFTYSLSVDLLGYLVEVVSGKSLDRYFADEIFSPLGMHDSYFYLPKDKSDRLVTLYAEVEENALVVSDGTESSFFRDDPLFPVTGAQTYFSGGAGLSSTASDYGRFLQMLLNDGELDGVRILGRKSVELMRSPRVDTDNDQVPDFGLGFSVINDLGNKGELGSVGEYSWGGAFFTSFWIDPRENLVAVFMSQVRPTNSDISRKFNTLVYQALE
jgi:CubicO group peptidase (beta-lactamase class C family)